MRRRRQDDDSLADVPERLRTFDRGWLEVAAQNEDGYAEALSADDAWLRDRRVLAAGQRLSRVGPRVAPQESRRALRRLARVREVAPLH